MESTHRLVVIIIHVREKKGKLYLIMDKNNKQYKPTFKQEEKREFGGAILENLFLSNQQSKQFPQYHHQPEWFCRLFSQRLNNIFIREIIIIYLMITKGGCSPKNQRQGGNQKLKNFAIAIFFCFKKCYGKYTSWSGNSHYFC